MLAFAGRDYHRIDFRPRDNFVVVRRRDLRADFLRKLLRRAEIAIRHGDEIHRRMRRREFGAQRPDAARPDDGEPDLFAFDEPTPYSIFRLSVLMTLPHFAASDLMYCANCSGVSPTGSAPCAIRRSLTSGNARMRTIPRLSAATTSRGVRAGAANPNKPAASKPGNDSATVGNSGNCGERFAVVTATA